MRPIPAYTDEIRERLLILHELASRRGGVQKKWDTCLWYQARTDERLRSFGVIEQGDGDCQWPTPKSRDFFGISFEEGQLLFRDLPKRSKALVMASILRARNRPLPSYLSKPLVSEYLRNR